MDQALNVADAAVSTDGARMALLGMDIAELEAAVTGAGLQKFRARQLWRWVWRHGLTSFDEMSDLGKPVRKQFAATFRIDRRHDQMAAPLCRRERGRNRLYSG